MTVNDRVTPALPVEPRRFRMFIDGEWADAGDQIDPYRTVRARELGRLSR